MGFRPPRGVRPPQLEGRRTGRPMGSRNYARLFRDAVWAFNHRHDEDVAHPNRSASLWWGFAQHYPDELETFLRHYGQL